MANSEIISDLQIVHSDVKEDFIVFDQQPAVIISGFVEVYLSPAQSYQKAKMKP
jgi:hypothetical protein